MTTRAKRLEETPQFPQQLAQLITSIAERARFWFFIILAIRLRKYFQIAGVKIPIHSEESTFIFIPRSFGLVDDENGPVPLVMATEFWDVKVVISGSLSRGHLGQNMDLALSDSLLLRRVGSKRHAPDVDAIRLVAATYSTLFTRLLVERFSQGLEVVRIGSLWRCIVDLERPLGAFICDVKV